MSEQEKILAYPAGNFDIEKFFDLTKETHSLYKNCKNLILQDYLTDFGLFYQNDLKYRKLCAEIKEEQNKQVPSIPKNEGLPSEVSRNNYRNYLKKCGEISKTVVGIICKRENFNIEEHRGYRTFHRSNIPFWLVLLGTEKMTLQVASAFVHEIDLKLKEKEIIYQRPKNLDSIDGKSFDDFTEEEEKAINHNLSIKMGLPLMTAYQQQQLKYFVDAYKNIPPDLETISMLRKQEISQPQTLKAIPQPLPPATQQKGFDFGLTEEQKAIYKHIEHLKGVNHSKDKIMSDANFERLLNDLYYLVEKDSLPTFEKPLPQIGVSNNSLIYTFRLIHKELFTTKKIRESFIYFLQKYFSQLSEIEQMKVAFSKKPPKNYPF